MGYAVHIPSLCRKYISPPTIRVFVRLTCDYTKVVFISALLKSPNDYAESMTIHTPSLHSSLYKQFFHSTTVHNALFTLTQDPQRTCSVLIHVLLETTSCGTHPPVTIIQPLTTTTLSSVLAVSSTTAQ